MQSFMDFDAPGICFTLEELRNVCEELISRGYGDCLVATCDVAHKPDKAVPIDRVRFAGCYSREDFEEEYPDSDIPLRKTDEVIILY